MYVVTAVVWRTWGKTTQCNGEHITVTCRESCTSSSYEDGLC